MRQYLVVLRKFRSYSLPTLRFPRCTLWKSKKLSMIFCTYSAARCASFSSYWSSSPRLLSLSDLSATCCWLAYRGENDYMDCSS